MLQVVHGISVTALKSTLEILLGGDWSLLILARRAAGKEDGNGADADNKNTARDAGYPCILPCAP